MGIDENGLEMSIKEKAIIQNEKAPWSYIPDFENKEIKRLHLQTFNGRIRDEYIGY